jgi:hypothetical protein
MNQMILLKVRLPRIIEALLTGAILTLAGQMFQTVLNINNAIKLALIEKMGTQIKDNPRNIANPEPNVAPHLKFLLLLV